MNELLPVSLIVLNYNGRSLLEACLQALLALDYPHFDVIVVDNASTDDSVELVRERFPQVQLLCSRKNLGFAGGNNVALRQLDTGIAVLVNPDVIVDRNWLRELVTPLHVDETIGLTGCKLYYPGGRLQHAGGYITSPQALPGHYGLNEEDIGQHDVIRDVDYVVGAALAIRRQVLDQIGLLDEGFFLYYEDVDLCVRTRRAGYRVVYVPKATGIHLESAVTQKDSFFYLQQMHTSRWRYLLKHYSIDEILSATIEAEKNWLPDNSPIGRLALISAYRTTLGNLERLWQDRVRDGANRVTAGESQQVRDELQKLYQLARQSFVPSSLLAELAGRARVWEKPFVSHLPGIGPLVARFREAWNSISTKWYVLPLLAQQNEFNQLLVEQLRRQEAALHHQQTWLMVQGDSYTDLNAAVAELTETIEQTRQLLTALEQRLTNLEEKRVSHD